MASLLIHLQFFLYLMRNASPQYGYRENIYYQNPAQQYYQQQEQMDYREREPHTSHRRQWMRGDDALRKKKKIYYYDSDEDDCVSKCSCDKCFYPTRCCRDICNYSCDETTPYPEPLLVPPVAPPVVFLPYPYPLMVPPRRPKEDDDEDESCSTTCSTTCSTKRTCTPDPCLTTDPCTTDPCTTDPCTTDPCTTDPCTTDPCTKDPCTKDPCTTDPCLTTDPCTTKHSSSTTTASTPSTTTCVTIVYIYKEATTSPTPKKTLRMGSDDDFYNLIMNHARKNMRPVNDKYMLSPRRRTKPTWVPKYGIIPIPDKLSERLMSQLRAVKGHNRQGRKEKQF